MQPKNCLFILFTAISGVHSAGVPLPPGTIADARVAQRQDEPPTPDPHRADFRTFGGDDCFTRNQGIYTLTQSNAGQCRSFVDVIGSLRREDHEDDTCAVLIYTQDDCSGEGVPVPRGVCTKGTWVAYELVCS